jgi:hypothetical protein
MQVRLFFAVAVLAPMVASASPNAARATDAALRQQVARIVVGSEGLTREQAHIVADAYIASYLGQRAGRVPQTPAFREGRYWLVPVWVETGPVRLGFQPVAPEGRIRIDRFTGTASFPKHPLVSLKELARRKGLTRRCS